MKFLRSQAGFSLPLILAFAVVMATMGTAIATVTLSNINFASHEQKSESALQIADAGINYYLWHLSHNASDFQDGGNTLSAPPYGPYVHSMTNSNGQEIGTYTLTITPPPNGSTITTVKSVGKVNGIRSTRTVLAQLGQPSFANYIFLSNTDLIFSPTSSTSGPVHSNVGVEFNGTNNGPVTASRTTYTTGSGTHNGVWGSGGPKSQWQYPVPTVDFNKVTANFSDLQTKAQNGGVLLGASGGIGWQIKLLPNGTMDLSKVMAESTTGITSAFVKNQAAPANGVVFSKENVWLSGPGYAGRITIAAARLPDSPSQRRSISIIGDITYAAKDGSSVVGLIAQQDIFVPQYVPNTMEVNAAMLAQYGSVGYDTQNGGLKNSFTLYGSIAQYANDYGFKVLGCGSFCRGFPTTNYNFDTNLTYAPPPQFPNTGTFSILNWRELLVSP